MCMARKKIDWDNLKLESGLEILHVDPENKKRIVCRCTCGKVFTTWKSCVVSNQTRSCGCKQYVGRKPKKGNNIIAKKPVRCPFPTPECTKNRLGLCCWDCSSYEECPWRCDNSPNRCGLLDNPDANTVEEKFKDEW